MERWYRIFGRLETAPEPGAILERLNASGAEVSGHFRGDDQGWFSADLFLAGTETPLRLERYLHSEEGIRAELNAWAAWLETCESGSDPVSLMERMIQTRQLFTLRVEEESVDERCVGLCRFLASVTDGIYQIDGQGFFAADGTLLVPEQ
jgi:hypothetical protein